MILYAKAGVAAVLLAKNAEVQLGFRRFPGPGTSGKTAHENTLPARFFRQGVPNARTIGKPASLRFGILPLAYQPAGHPKSIMSHETL